VENATRRFPLRLWRENDAVKLSESLAKVGQPLTYRRAWRRARRLLHPVPIAPLMAKIDRERLSDLRARYGALRSDSPGLWRHYAKYLDVEKHVRQNVRRAQDLDLHRMRRQRILDLGCGGGFFLFVIQSLGHEGLGLDVAGIPVFDSLVEMLGVDRRICKITGFEPLPELDGKFDLITAFATAFQGGREDSWRWGAAEWDLLLADLKGPLNPGGRIFFELNAAYEGQYYTREIADVFVKHGGVTERERVLFTKETAQR
jgi:SAM-dependent methyltransferase